MVGHRRAMNAAACRRYQARQKAKREAGDAVAIARYKQTNHRREQRQKELRRRAKAERVAAKGYGSEPPPYTEQDAKDFAKRSEERGRDMHAGQAGHGGEIGMEIKESTSGKVGAADDPDVLARRANAQGRSAGGGQRRGLRIADLLNAEGGEKDELSWMQMEKTLRMRKLRLEREKAMLEQRLREVEVEMVASERKLEDLVDETARE